MPALVPRFEDPAFSADVLPNSTPPVPGTAPKLNFDNDDGQLLVFNNLGQMVLANPIETLEQLITKAIVTERMLTPNYPEDFGSDFWIMIGRGLSEIAVEKLAETFVREALRSINLIRNLDQFATKIEGDQLFIHFRVITVEGILIPFDFSRVV